MQIKLLIALLFFKTIIQYFPVVISLTSVYISDSSPEGFLCNQAVKRDVLFYTFSSQLLTPTFKLCLLDMWCRYYKTEIVHCENCFPILYNLN